MRHMLFIVEPLGQCEERGLEGGKLAHQEMLDYTEALRLAGERTRAAAHPRAPHRA